MRIACLSDTHGDTDVEIPPCDVLVYAGDACQRGTAAELELFYREVVAGAPCETAIYVAGNHDRPLAHSDPTEVGLPESLVYLEGESVDIDGLTVWGGPWHPEYGEWPFQLPRRDLAAKWAQIPEGADVIVTHGPPKGVLDAVDTPVVGSPEGEPSGQLSPTEAALRRAREDARNRESKRVGDEALADRVFELAPDLHVFGHVHESAGLVERAGITFCNASWVGSIDDRRVGGPPYVVELDPDR